MKNGHMGVPPVQYPAPREVAEALGISKAGWRRTLSWPLESS